MSKTSDSAPNPLGKLIVEIFRLNGVLLREGDRLTEDLAMTSARWQVLGALELAREPLTASQIAREMGLTRQSVQRIVNELGADGFISFSGNPEHRRAKLIAPTGKGRRTFREIMRRQVDWTRRVLAVAAVSERRIREAESVIRKLRETLEEIGI
jgi:DNA-binding MarR family transcriptional regulator